MDPVTRWKTITTIAVAFSAGNLFATACQDATKAQASDAANASETTTDGTTEGNTTAHDASDTAVPPPEVTEADLAAVVDALTTLSDTVAELGTTVSTLTTSLSTLRSSVDALQTAAATTETRFEQHRCLLDYLRDADQDGEESEDNSDLDEYEIVTAMALCGFE
ncbi:MAG: hypothetical protein CL927_16065 [Deltaproteobacteria bacterium]|nr:hypothetical protein [Deltaproteobacteria bacterium]